ncbi:peptidyl-tRNA hydrolase, partial [Geobacillus sp. MMMUD3]|nr:peptidyl-tRNA hydrolase [Geobacillus sp. MMMUD3]
MAEQTRIEQMRRHETDHDVPWSLPIVVRKSK